jgi:branched-chain amino acid transport system permease protein
MKPAKFTESTVTVAIAVIATCLINFTLTSYWVFLCTSAIIAAIALQGVGLVASRAGMISLCQMSFAAIGAWVVAWLNVNGAPGTLLLWVALGGLAAVPLGIAIGLPALRLRGINLAIVTLGFAAAFDVILLSYTFPGQTKFIFVQRPAFFSTDQAYFALCVGVFVAIALVLNVLNRSPMGASWLSIRHSERSTAAHGVSIPQSKLSAFAISAFISGVSGGLLAGQLGTLVADSFSLMVSLVYFVVTTMAGAHLVEGAVFGGILIIFFPEVLRRLNLPQDIGNMFFALGATQALSMGGSMSEDLRRGLSKRFGRKLVQSTRHANVGNAAILPPKLIDGAAHALEVKNLTVRYGNVVALNEVSFVVPEMSVVGLIGPNGAGKSTFIDAVTGFLQSYDGTILLSGKPLDALPAHKRAQSGVRRTWQQTRIAPQLNAGTYLTLAAGKRLSRARESDLLEWMGCPGPDTQISSIDAGTRRLIDVAGVIAAGPKVVLLDEPAAGLSHEESLLLASRIALIPERYGISVLLVEHDMDLVRMVCNTAVVLDFGKVIASGPTAAVLSDPAVIKAYIGDPEELLAS